MNAQMLMMIVQHTPAWVWGLLAALLALGLSQTRTQQVSEGRLRLLPLAFVGLGVWGTLSAFGWHSGVALAWAGSFVLSYRLVRGSGWPGAARYVPAQQGFHVPGSWLPLALMMAIFVLKYAVGVTLSMQPQLAQTADFAIAVSAAYGALSAVFMGRARNILARAPAQAGAAATLAA
ncbi:hypothetical protein PFX98_15755 [Paucibacter sediminis]|uniref:DUF1453 domain-containing protein n=1 Tax=Paucibacter sediminis TaxID=3019553 RepID=A0AA95NGE7_9BURK|nr:DUF6622 family protein [Paucibacter sp. S2-9]WIT10366.1 hypothetical protein PFX98_15755 [Paucibacter sp. S2-9]